MIIKWGRFKYDDIVNQWSIKSVEIEIKKKKRSWVDFIFIILSKFKYNQ